MNLIMLCKTTEEWLNKLSEDEIKTIRCYTADSYIEINEHLRELNIDNSLEAIISKIDRALLKNKLLESINVYRAEGREIPLYKLKSYFKDINSIEYPNFISTTLHKEIAVGFIENLKYENRYKSFILIEVDLKAGCECAFIGNEIAVHNREYEILIMRNKTLFINNVKVDKGILNIRGELE